MRDPFDRAVAKEARLRRRADELTTRRGVSRLILRWYGALLLGWALLIAGHWVVFPEPRWLAVAHTVGFALYSGLAVLAFAFFRTMIARRPEMLDDDGL